MNDRIKAVVYPLLTFVAIVASWLVAVRVLKVPNYVLPTPEAVLGALKRGYVDGQFWEHFFYTLRSTAAGYVIGCGLAFVLACAFAESKTIERLFYPYIVALQAMPKVALAPLILVWFGFDMASKIVMVALVCFFPVFVNTVVGLRQTPPALLDLMTAFSASPLHVLVRIKIPSAAGHVFAALQIAIVMSLIGAVVAEFVASTKGLGHLISASAVNMDTSTMFAALASLAVLGVAASALVRFLHRRVVFWDRAASTSGVVAE